MRKILLLLLLCICSFCYSQGFSWAKQESSWYIDNCNYGTVDNTGNAFVLLTNYEDITIGGMLYTWCASPGNILIKYSPSGAVLWARKICVHACIGITTDADGNCIVSGRAYTGNYFQDGPGAYDTLTIGTTGVVAFLARYSPSGDLLWLSFYDPTSVSESAGTIAADPQGNICALIGADSTYSSRFIIAKFNSSGSLTWTITSALIEYAEVYRVATDALSNIYVQGGTNKSFSLDGVLINAGNTVETFLMKIDSSGNIMWLKEYIGGWVRGLDMNITPSGNIVLSGEITSGTLSLGTELLYEDNCFVTKLDVNG